MNKQQQSVAKDISIARGELLNNFIYPNLERVLINLQKLEEKSNVEIKRFDRPLKIVLVY